MRAAILALTLSGCAYVTPFTVIDQHIRLESDCDSRADPFYRGRHSHLGGNMNAELKQKWVAALRSGDYRQTDGAYYAPSTDGYCCLGVLTCVALGIKARTVHDIHDIGQKIDKWLDERPNVFGTLARMNDGDDGRVYTFPEIADYIEANL
jgi:hypothetical protein